MYGKLPTYFGHLPRNTFTINLPNVGKSTLFNALTETQAAQAANYPFCTIEPNVGCCGCIINTVIAYGYLDCT